MSTKNLIQKFQGHCYLNFTNLVNIPTKMPDDENLHAKVFRQLNCTTYLDNFKKTFLPRKLNGRFARKSTNFPSLKMITMLTDVWTIHHTTRIPSSTHN